MKRLAFPTQHDIEGTRHTLAYGQYQLSYEIYGSGDRVLVWMHGLLLDANLSRGLARRLAAKGNRVVLLDHWATAGATSPATLAPTGWISTLISCYACWTSSAWTRWFWAGSRWVPM